MHNNQRAIFLRTGFELRRINGGNRDLFYRADTGDGLGQLTLGQRVGDKFIGTLAQQ